MRSCQRLRSPRACRIDRCLFIAVVIAVVIATALAFTLAVPVTSVQREFSPGTFPVGAADADRFGAGVDA